ncbi:MAG: hypothetical protein IPI90_11225 [Saprospiraceae bacterium]|nr:hypothetical protein [Candidatus Vicinibacter affinis]
MKEIKIENVPTLSNLLASSKSKYKSFYDFIDNKGPISVLDLGCGFPWHLIFIYHNFKYKRLLGLDIQPRHSYHIGNQKSQIKSVLPELTVDEFNTLDTFFKVYDKFFDCDHRYHKKIKDEIEWKKYLILKQELLINF